MTKRKLNVWVAIAEIVSAAAVVISLIYVGFEIRRSTLESEADIQAELLTYTVQRRYLVVESSDLSSLLAKGYADPTRLSPDEMLRFQSYIELFYVAWERAYMTWEAGVNVTDGTAFSCYDPRIAGINDSDEVVVVYTKNYISDTDVWYSYSTDGGGSWVTNNGLGALIDENEERPDRVAAFSNTAMASSRWLLRM